MLKLPLVRSLLFPHPCAEARDVLQAVGGLVQPGLISQEVILTAHSIASCAGALIAGYAIRSCPLARGDTAAVVVLLAVWFF